MEMKTLNVYKLESTFKDMDDSNKVDEYNRLVEAHNDTIETLNAFVRLASRLPQY